jgi:predicted lipoprotein with Yx(FWY)xxD motif
MGVSTQSLVSRIAMRKRTAPVVAGLAVASVAGIAFAAAPPTVMKGTARVNGSNRTVLVSGSGQTLYWLSDERVGNLKCLTQACFAVWPPLKVGANERLTKGPGVNGTLSKLRRVRGGFYQVMLNGHPLYRYSGDNNTKGSAKGQAIRSYGGIWYVINQ